ncbi:hypothetical protein N7470_000291 [Penicillium chermesinum]|nr:hypothetical protein N7470_000291 [Penicillium chermesinum]
MSTLVPPRSASSQAPIIHGPATIEMSNTSTVSRRSSVTTAVHEKKDVEPSPPPPLPRHSTELGAPVKVPRLQRKGLLGQITLLAEVENPRTYSRRTKWFISFVVALAAIATPLGSSIFFLFSLLASLSQVAKDLHASDTITNLTISLYLLAMAIFPLWWSSFSERLGRRSIYLVSFALFVVFNCLCAISSSISMLIVMRMLSGGAAASVQAVGAGTIADIWHPYERGQAMSMFFLGPLCGPLLAPIIGGLLSERWGWRSTLWFSAAFGAFILCIILFSLPETLAAPKPILPDLPNDASSENRRLSRVSTQQVARSTTRYLKFFKMTFIDPLKVVLYLRHLPVLLSVYYGSIAFGALNVLNVSIEYSFDKPPYKFGTIIVGLLYIPNSLGYFIAAVFGGRWMDRIMQREAKRANRYDEKGRLVFHPEDRMRENAWLGAFLFPAGLLWYGWTVDKGVFWLVPMIANFFFGIGSMLIFTLVTTMLTEFMPKKSSTGVALNNFMRNILACIGSLITAPVISAIGNGWLFTILGIVGFASGSVVLAMKVYGSRWRAKMDAVA